MSEASSPSTDARAAHRQPRRRFHFRLRGFTRDERGVSAVEFAALAVPFLGIICATFETSIDYWAQLTLDAALQDASREIYTGKFQKANGGSKSQEELLSALRTNLCTKDGKARLTMFNCNNVKLSVTNSITFPGATSTSPTKTDANTNQTSWDPNFGKFASAAPGTIMRVQAAVDYPVFFNLIRLSGTRFNGNRRILQAAAVFRTEPY